MVTGRGVAEACCFRADVDAREFGQLSGVHQLSKIPIHRRGPSRQVRSAIYLAWDQVLFQLAQSGQNVHPSSEQEVERMMQIFSLNSCSIALCLRATVIWRNRVGGNPDILTHFNEAISTVFQLIGPL